MDSNSIKYPEIVDRFLGKVSKTEYCWNWTASGRGLGYGAMKINGKLIDAHRISYLLFVGDIPEGMFVCHICDNKKCVNPDHLFLGSPRDNVMDAVNKDRQFQPGVFTISQEEKDQIIADYIPGIFGYKKLARKYNISYSYIGKIIRNALG